MEFVQEKVEFPVVDGKLWLPIRTKPLHEFRLHAYCKGHDIPVYLPVVSQLHPKHIPMPNKMYSYHETVMRPLLSSYIFVQLDDKERKSIWNSQSVSCIIPVPDFMQNEFLDELRSIQMMEDLAKTKKLEYHKDIQVNDRFEIESPSQYAGVRGYLVSKNEKKFVWIVKLDMIGGIFMDAVIDPSQYKLRKLLPEEK